jgi:hypothetical protein
MGDPEGNCAVSTTDVKAGDHVIRLNRAGQGNGPAVLFLHGSGPGATGMSNFSGNVEAFAEHHDCLIIDQVGCGDSSHPELGRGRRGRRGPVGGDAHAEHQHLGPPPRGRPAARLHGTGELTDRRTVGGANGRHSDIPTQRVESTYLPKVQTNHELILRCLRIETSKCVQLDWAWPVGLAMIIDG